MNIQLDDSQRQNQELLRENATLATLNTQLNSKVLTLQKTVDELDAEIAKSINYRPYVPIALYWNISYVNHTSSRKSSLQLLFKDEGEGIHSWYMTCGISQPTSYDSLWDLGNTYLSGKFQLTSTSPVLMSHAGTTTSANVLYKLGVGTSIYLHYNTEDDFIYIPYAITFSTTAYQIPVFKIQWSNGTSIISKISIDATEISSHTFPALTSA